MTRGKRRVTPAEVPLLARFEELRGTLLNGSMEDRLDKPLSFWALADDRQLPFALLNHSVRTLLATSFEEIYGTQGIGRKKLVTFMALLGRVAAGSKPPEPAASVDGDASQPSIEPGGDLAVSEALWQQWRTHLARLGIGHEPLGRLAPSLQDLPRSIWSEPLADFIGITLAELRELKTYGAKRVNTVIEVMRTVYASVATVAEHDHLAICLVPRAIERIESWLQQAFANPSEINETALRSGLLEPLMQQILIDGGEKLVLVAEARIAPKDFSVNIRQVAFHMGVTPSRVYQLLDDVSAILRVRWPRGQAQLRELNGRITAKNGDPAATELLAAVMILFTVAT